MKRIALAVATLALATGCATVSRQSYIDDQVGQYEYDLPLAQVWPHARALLQEQGYSLRETQDPPEITTEWKEEMANSAIAATRVRYRVEGFELHDKTGATYSKVRITRLNMTAAGMDGSGMIVDARKGSSEGTANNPNMAGVSYGQTATAQAAAGVSANNTGVASTTRDLRMEWLLMRRADPDSAQKLEEYAAANYK